MGFKLDWNDWFYALQEEDQQKGHSFQSCPWKMWLHPRRWQTKGGLWPLLIACSHRLGSWESVCILFPNDLEGLPGGGPLGAPGAESTRRGSCRQPLPWETSWSQASAHCSQSIFPSEKGSPGTEDHKSTALFPAMFMLAWTVDSTSLGSQFPMRANVSEVAL